MAQPCPGPWPGVPLDLGPLRFRKVRHKNLVCLLGVILHNGLYIVMEFMSKVGAPSRCSASGPATTQPGGQNPRSGLGLDGSQALQPPRKAKSPGSPLPLVLTCFFSSVRAIW